MKAKVAFGVASVLALVGVVLLIVAGTAGAAAGEVDPVVKDQRSFSLSVTSETDCGYSLFLRATGDCGQVKAGTTVTSPQGSSMPIWGGCDAEQGEWETKHDPPLQGMGHFSIKKDNGVAELGSYQVSSPASLWAVDYCAEIGEAVTGIVAMMGVFVVAIIVFIVSCVLCCVGCCCMSPKQQPTTITQGSPAVLGQATPSA